MGNSTASSAMSVSVADVLADMLMEAAGLVGDRGDAAPIKATPSGLVLNGFVDCRRGS